MNSEPVAPQPEAAEPYQLPPLREPILSDVSLAAETEEAEQEAQIEATAKALGTRPAPGNAGNKNRYRAMEIARQVFQVQEWLTLGFRPNEIRVKCREEWGLGTRCAETRIAEARRQMVIDADNFDRKEFAAKMLQNLEKVLAQSLQNNQGSNAIGAMRLQSELLQLIQKSQ